MVCNRRDLADASTLCIKMANDKVRMAVCPKINKAWKKQTGVCKLQFQSNLS